MSHYLFTDLHDEKARECMAMSGCQKYYFPQKDFLTYYKTYPRWEWFNKKYCGKKMLLGKKLYCAPNGLIRPENQ